MMGGTYTITGDSTTNVIGSDPGLISPTLTSSVTESALTANFGITSTSLCINAGEIIGAFADSIDYIGNPRIMGELIDIGAYEVLRGVGINPTKQVQSIDFSIYPNPASNLLFVNVKEIAGNIEVIDMTGKKVTQCKVTGKLNFFDIHQLQPGVYFAVWNCNGISKSAQKFVVNWYPEVNKTHNKLKPTVLVALNDIVLDKFYQSDLVGHRVTGNDVSTGNCLTAMR